MITAARVEELMKARRMGEFPKGMITVAEHAEVNRRWAQLEGHHTWTDALLTFAADENDRSGWLPGEGRVPRWRMKAHHASNFALGAYPQERLQADLAAVRAEYASGGLAAVQIWEAMQEDPEVMEMLDRALAPNLPDAAYAPGVQRWQRIVRPDGSVVADHAWGSLSP